MQLPEWVKQIVANRQASATSDPTVLDHVEVHRANVRELGKMEDGLTRKGYTPSGRYVQGRVVAFALVVVVAVGGWFAITALVNSPAFIEGKAAGAADALKP